jgi:hypothetical protein
MEANHDNKLIDTPPNFLMDSIASLKVKTMKGEGVGARFLVRCTSGVHGHVGALGWDSNE